MILQCSNTAVLTTTYFSYDSERKNNLFDWIYVEKMETLDCKFYSYSKVYNHVILFVGSKTLGTFFLNLIDLFQAKSVKHFNQ